MPHQRTSRRASLSVDVMNTPQTSQTVMVRSRSVALRCASSYSARVISTCESRVRAHTRQAAFSLIRNSWSWLRIDHASIVCDVCRIQYWHL